MDEIDDIIKKLNSISLIKEIKPTKSSSLINNLETIPSAVNSSFISFHDSLIIKLMLGGEEDSAIKMLRTGILFSQIIGETDGNVHSALNPPNIDAIIDVAMDLGMLETIIVLLEWLDKFIVKFDERTNYLRYISIIIRILSDIQERPCTKNRCLKIQLVNSKRLAELTNQENDISPKIITPSDKNNFVIRVQKRYGKEKTGKLFDSMFSQLNNFKKIKPLIFTMRLPDIVISNNISGDMIGVKKKKRSRLDDSDNNDKKSTKRKKKIQDRVYSSKQTQNDIFLNAVRIGAGEMVTSIINSWIKTNSNVMNVKKILDNVFGASLTTPVTTDDPSVKKSAEILAKNNNVDLKFVVSSPPNSPIDKKDIDRFIIARDDIKDFEQILYRNGLYNLMRSYRRREKNMTLKDLFK